MAVPGMRPTGVSPVDFFDFLSICRGETGTEVSNPEVSGLEPRPNAEHRVWGPLPMRRMGKMPMPHFQRADRRHSRGVGGKASLPAWYLSAAIC